MITAVVGKGGVGKTTLSALLLRGLLDAGETPILAIDADPSNCLGAALGVRVTRTLGEVREEMRDTPGRPAAMSQAEWLALSAEEAIVEARGFDLLTMGRPEGKGCYCFVNNLIRDHLDRLGRAYRHVLIDCEAGLEHLSRRTAGRVDALICVASRARMAAETIARALTVYRDVQGALPSRVELVLNGFDAGEQELIRAQIGLASGGQAGFDRVRVLPIDPAVAACEAEGRSLLTLPADAPVLQALAVRERAA
ncbi:MAG: AAA family ATPase [Vicinamibacteria bacterium]|jgi:CO dehydrogenase maturation factor|nr:AAA family ATPase [Vicinamibacteria bacterium]